jgi:hypothetical protein
VLDEMERRMSIEDLLDRLYLCEMALTRVIGKSDWKEENVVIRSH